jgi:hypothetical protein
MCTRATLHSKKVTSDEQVGLLAEQWTAQQVRKGALLLLLLLVVAGSDVC